MSTLMLMGVAPANADVPAVPESAAFTATACEGSTPGLGDLVVAGAQLDNYNAGNIAVLYPSEGERAPGNGRPPGCGVRYVESAAGPVSEWMYCTDKNSWACLAAGEDGELRDSAGQILDPMTWVEGNPRLSEDQAKLFSYILHNEIAVTARSYWPESPAMNASNESYLARDVRQDLIWCVSDRDLLESDVYYASHVEWCDLNMGAERQAEILASIPETHVLELSLDGDNSDLPVGDTASFHLITNVFNTPIELAASGEDLSVCSGNATISGNMLTVLGTDASTTQLVELCASGIEVGETVVSVNHTPSSLEDLSWSQAHHATNMTHCQVYAALETTRLVPLVAQARANFIDPQDVSEGTFSLQKVLAGVTEDDFATGTTFSVEATWSIDEEETTEVFSLPASGEVVASETVLPTGTVVTFSEGSAPAAAGYTFSNVEFSPTTVTIVSAENTLVEVTNTYEPVSEVPSYTPNPTSPQTVSAAGSSNQLAKTGDAWRTATFVVGAVVLSMGVLILVRRRLFSHSE